jgi:hypothetical protein
MVYRLGSGKADVYACASLTSAPYRKFLLSYSGSHVFPLARQFVFVQSVREACGSVIVRDRLNHLISAFAIKITRKSYKRNNRPVILNTIGVVNSRIGAGHYGGGFTSCV